jgi:hypothetical protein
MLLERRKCPIAGDDVGGASFENRGDVLVVVGIFTLIESRDGCAPLDRCTCSFHEHSPMQLPSGVLVQATSSENPGSPALVSFAFQG